MVSSSAVPFMTRKAMRPAITRMIAEATLVWMLLCLLPATLAQNATDGNETASAEHSRCYQSNFSAGNATAKDELGVELYPICPGQTSVVFTDSNMTEGEALIASLSVPGGSPVLNFSMAIKLDALASYSKGNSSDIETIPESMTTYVRLQICHTNDYGCNPLPQASFDEPASATFANVATSIPYVPGMGLQAQTSAVGMVTPPIEVILKRNPDGLYEADLVFSLRLPTRSDPGDYYVIAYIAAYSASDWVVTGIHITQRLDKVVKLIYPPDMLLVSKGMLVYVGVTTAICGSVALIFFLYVVYHRRHPVMKLAQGPFLATLAAACFIQIAFSFTDLPTKDIFCQLRGPLVLLPVHVGGVVLIARAWRVYVTLSPACALGRANTSLKQPKSRFFCGVLTIRTLTFLAYLPKHCGLTSRGGTGSMLRASATEGATWFLVVMLTIPQLALQLFGAIYYERASELAFEPEDNVVRQACLQEGRWVTMVGTAIIALVYVLVVLVAWISRKLPSTFNEKDQAFQAASANAVIAFLVLALLEIAADATTPPDVEVFLRTFLSLGNGMVNCIILILPKIKRVQSGEKVVISDLLDARYHGNKYTTPEKLRIREGDPLPPWIIGNLLELQTMLHYVAEKCGDGRSLSKKEWTNLERCTRAFQEGIDRVDYSCELHETGVEAATVTQPPSGISSQSTT